MRVYVGMDVHRKRSQVALLDEHGVQLANRNLPMADARGSSVASERAEPGVHGWDEQGRGGRVLGVDRVEDANRLRSHQRRASIQHRQQPRAKLDREPAGQPEQLPAGGDLAAAQLRQQRPQPGRTSRVQVAETGPRQGTRVHGRGS